ncbi:hypothetical protein DFJ73DRAFT_646678, partial [Zopfochytrium polystomum]
MSDIKAITEKIKQLKASKADKALIDEQVALLAELKGKKSGAAAAAAAGASDAKGAADARKFELKTPKGTRDFTPEEMAIRESMFKTITTVFKRHGAVTIDTPVFELKEILTGKYGEDSKLIYDLQDQGGEACSLRYDLTVPFARYIATAGLSNIKRYHIAKVYRRDNPSVNKGRMREFYQCDFDIAGEYGSMIPDAEAVRVMVEVLKSVDIGAFKVKINNRKILDGMFEVCGVPPEKFRAISSAVDKLDKSPWAEVKVEMVKDKGLPEEVADRIAEYVKHAGGAEICNILEADEAFSKNKRGMEGVADMRLLFQYLDILGVKDYMSFDLSLARGLDYYTGVIYEAVFEANTVFCLSPVIDSLLFSIPALPCTEATEGVGSIAAGGRYDELVGMFCGRRIPCVGISIGVERVFAILLNRLRSRQEKEKVRTNDTEVYVIGLGTGHLAERMKVAKELWDAGISAEFTFKEKPRRDGEFKAVKDEQIPVSVVLDNAKVAEGKVQVENTATKEQVVVDRSELVAVVKKFL